MRKEFCNVETFGMKYAIKSMRDKDGSWNKSDSGYCMGGDNHIGCENCALNKTCKHYFDNEFKIGKNDMDLAHALLDNGNEEFLKMIHVQADTNTETIDTDYKYLRKFYLRWLNSVVNTDNDIAYINLISTLPYAKELIMYR